MQLVSELHDNMSWSIMEFRADAMSMAVTPRLLTGGDPADVPRRVSGFVGMPRSSDFVLDQTAVAIK